MSLGTGTDGSVRVSATQPGCDDVTVVFEGTLAAHFTTTKAPVCLLNTETYGEVLFMDGQVQSSQADERLYHEALVVPAISARADCTGGDVLILGGGEGCVAREVFKWGAKSITQYDHDEQFVRWARHGLAHWNCGAYDDPRLQFHSEDVEVAMKYGRKYDTIFVDLFDPDKTTLNWFSDVLLGCVRKLRAGGVLAAYIGDAPRGAADVSAEIVFRLVETLGERGCVIPYRVYVPSFYGEACFVFVSVDGAMPAVERLGASQANQNAPQAIQNAPQFMDEVSWVRACTWGLEPSPVFRNLSKRYMSFLSGI